jgi:methylenetetrahydrofolate reductase (NADPH)
VRAGSLPGRAAGPTLATMARGLPSLLPGGSPSVHDTLRDVLAAGQRSFSFEFFPPKDDAGEAVLWQAMRRLEALGPTFVSVTYGAGGSTRDRTVRATRRMAEQTTLTPVAHLTCVGASRSELRRVIGEYADAGVRTVLAIRGDAPGGPGTPWTPHEDGVDTALDLVRMLRRLGDFSVGVAAFPEGHPESPSLEHDARVLALKEQAGADFAVTQFFFRAEDYFALVERAQRAGCTIPVIPGIMPVTNLRQIERFAALSGASLPAGLVAELRRVGDDPAAVREVGVQAATDLAARLLAGGAPGLHFYTLNRSTATLDIYTRLGLERRPCPSARTAVGRPA